MTYEIGRVIKERRKAIKMSVDELSSITGLAASYIYQIESDERSPSFDKVKLISEALNYEVSLMLLKSLKGDIVSEKLMNIYEENQL